MVGKQIITKNSGKSMVGEDKKITIFGYFLVIFRSLKIFLPCFSRFLLKMGFLAKMHGARRFYRNPLALPAVLRGSRGRVSYIHY